MTPSEQDRVELFMLGRVVGSSCLTITKSTGRKICTENSIIEDLGYNIVADSVGEVNEDDELEPKE